MTELYIVEKYQNKNTSNYSTIVAIFSTEEKAKEFITKHSIYLEEFLEYFNCKKMKLDDSPPYRDRFSVCACKMCIR